MKVEERAEPKHVVGIEHALPGEQRVLEAAERSLSGERRGLRALAPFLGPAFIACVAYVDPGNFATNIAAGSKYGYLLLWVILASNLMAMLIQTMSAKLGIATGDNLAELGFLPDVRVVMLAAAPFDGPLTVEVAGERHAISRELAERIRIGGTA